MAAGQIHQVHFPAVPWFVEIPIGPAEERPPRGAVRAGIDQRTDGTILPADQKPQRAGRVPVTKISGPAGSCGH